MWKVGSWVQDCHFNLIDKGTFWLFREQETNLVECDHLNLSEISPCLHMP